MSQEAREKSKTEVLTVTYQALATCPCHPHASSPRPSLGCAAPSSLAFQLLLPPGLCTLSAPLRRLSGETQE